MNRRNDPLGQVQRTLILSCGELASLCGSQFEKVLVERDGPTAATAIVTLSGEKAEWEMAIAAALNRISPPDLAARLGAGDWQLIQPPAIHLVLLLTAEADCIALFPTLLQGATDQIYQQLGLEPLILPIWLVGEEGDISPLANQTTHYPLPWGSLLLGMCNQDGLRLPDEQSLSAIGAEILWCITTASLLPFLEQRQPDTPAGELQFMTAGVHVWAWSPTEALTQFVSRWRRTVVAQWLSNNLENERMVNVPGWLQAQQLTPQQFATVALGEREAAPPQLPTAEWQMPWPWQVPALFEKSRFENNIDEEATRAYSKQAQLRLVDPLRHAADCLHQEACQQLNAQPVAGIARLLAWIQAVTEACEAYLPTLFEWENNMNETSEALSTIRGSLETILKEKLSGYPATLPKWVRLLWRPWRWPGHWLTYWRLQKAGQQLCHVYLQQAALRRQRIEQKTAYRGIIELTQTVHRLGNQVAEIREMLQSRLRSETETAESVGDSSPAAFPHTMLTVPDSFYEAFIPDILVEANLAAEGIGGLGHQIRHLDDAVFEQLATIAEKRLAKLHQLTPVELLLARLSGEKQTADNHLQSGWAEACPLWPVEIASLDETGRLQQQPVTIICGAHPLSLSDNFIEMSDSVYTLSNGWSRHLWLLRCHLGLPAAAVFSNHSVTEESTLYE